MTTIILDGEFLTLNEYIAIERGNKYAAAKAKRDETARVALDVTRYRRIDSSEYPVDIVCKWVRCNSKTDPDNVSFAIKFILDGLVSGGVLRGDTMKDINSISHYFYVVDKIPYVMVEIIGVGSGG